MSKSNKITRVRIRTAQTNVEQPSLFFDQWSGGDDVKDDSGKSRPLYHGTTHEFDTFRTNPHQNRNGYFGDGFYFTDSQIDAQKNYAGIGPDLATRVEKRIEIIEQEVYDNPEDFMHLNIWKNKRSGVIDAPKMLAYARERAKKELIGPLGNNGKVMPNYLRMKNPVKISPNNGTQFAFDSTGTGYDREVNESGTAWDLYNAVRDVSSDYGIDGDSIWEDLSSYLNFEDGVSAWDVDRRMRDGGVVDQELDNNFNTDGDDGNTSVGPFIADVLKRMGFDGIQMDAYAAFGPKKNSYGKMIGGMDGITPGTNHYISWDSHGIKSSENNALYDTKDPRVTAYSVSRRLVESVRHIDRYSPESASVLDGVLARLAMALPVALPLTIHAMPDDVNRHEDSNAKNNDSLIRGESEDCHHLPEEMYDATTNFPDKIIKVRIRTAQSNVEQPSLFFDQWSGGDEVKDESGKSRPLYHGTTHEFDTFSPTNNGHSANNYYGKGFYLTSNAGDALGNYAQLTDNHKFRIQDRADKLMRDQSYDEQTNNPHLFDERGGYMFQAAKDHYRAKARESFVGALGEPGRVMSNYVRMKNPVVIEPGGGTIFKDNATEQNAGGQSHGQKTGSSQELRDAIIRIAPRFGIDGHAVWQNLSSDLNFREGSTAWEVDNSLRGSKKLADQMISAVHFGRYVLDENDSNSFEPPIGEFLSDVFHEMGYDGIDMDAYAVLGPNGNRAGMDHVAPGTRHIITRDPTAIKSSDDNALYDTKDPRVTAYSVSRRLVESARHIDRYSPESAGVLDGVLTRLAMALPAGWVPTIHATPNEVNYRYHGG